MDPSRVTLCVIGRVQGVGFRYFTAAAARRLGLCGTVRNLPDGSVEVVAEGPRGRLEEFLSAVRRGPTGSRVEQVIAHFDPPLGMAPGFEITG